MNSKQITSADAEERLGERMIKGYQSIAFYGECMIELQTASAGILNQSFAGDTLNTAIYLARLTTNDQIHIEYVTGLGCDEFSDQMIERWSKEGVKVNYTRRYEDKLPGMYYVQTDEHGERSFLYWRGQSAAKYFMDKPEEISEFNQLAQFPHHYLSGITLAVLTPKGRENLLAHLKCVRENGGKIYFDNNFRPRLWKDRAEAKYWYEQVLHITDIALLTIDDEFELWQDNSVENTVLRCESYQIPEIVIKRGKSSCLIIDNGHHLEVEAVTLRPEQVTDTNAAGDSFSAGYLAGRLRGHSKKDAATLGHQTASKVIQHPGAIIPKHLMA